jgi:hypothetical protein
MPSISLLAYHFWPPTSAASRHGRPRPRGRSLGPAGKPPTPRSHSRWPHAAGTRPTVKCELLSFEWNSMTHLADLICQIGQLNATAGYELFERGQGAPLAGKEDGSGHGVVLDHQNGWDWWGKRRVGKYFIYQCNPSNRRISPVSSSHLHSNSSLENRQRKRADLRRWHWLPNYFR